MVVKFQNISINEPDRRILWLVRLRPIGKPAGTFPYGGSILIDCSAATSRRSLSLFDTILFLLSRKKATEIKYRALRVGMTCKQDEHFQASPQVIFQGKAPFPARLRYAKAAVIGKAYV